MIAYKKILFAFLFSVFFLPQLLLAQNNDSTQAVDPNEILGKYINAIGGREAFSKINDMTAIMRGTAMGQTITLTVKKKAPNKLRQEVKAGGMEQIVIYDGEKGVMMVMDKKIEVKDKELEGLKIEASMDFLFDPQSFGATISYDGLEQVNGKDAYKIKMVLPSGLRWYSYFDTESGLKVKETREIETKMGLGEQTITYDDFKEVDGIKFPYKITQTFGGQAVDVVVSSIKLNKGLSDDIFVIGE